MNVHRTKIGATIGPSCASLSVLERMVDAGMNFARLNFSHGTYKDHTELIRILRRAEKNTHTSCTILQDLQGPKIRLGMLPKEGVEIKKDEQVVFSTTSREYKDGVVPLLFDQVERYIKSGHRILIDDGRLEVRVEKIQKYLVTVRVVEGGILLSHKGLNFPDTRFSIPALSTKDKKDVLFGIAQGVDVIALSFVKKANDIIELRRYIQKHQKKNELPIRIIAKIERPEAIENLIEIVMVSDGIMVARGDLGLEMPEEELPILQKKIIGIARQYHKPVMVATQLLDSMREHKRPTRAEVTDVANSVIDHADSLLLTNETAVGVYPVDTVNMMRKIIERTEMSPYDDLVFPERFYPNAKAEQLISELAHVLIQDKQIRFLVVHDSEGKIIPFLSHIRPELTIIAGVSDMRTVHQMNMFWGVTSIEVPSKDNKNNFLKKVLLYIKNHYYLTKGVKLVYIEYATSRSRTIEGGFEIIMLT